MLVAFLVAKKYLLYVVPVYESTTKLRLADLSEGVPNSNLFKDLDVFATSQKLNAEIEVLKSDLIIEKTLNKLDFNTVVSRVGEIKTQELYHDSPILVKVIKIEKQEHNKPVLFEIKDLIQGEIIVDKDTRIPFKIGDTVKVNNSSFLFELDKDLINNRPNIQVDDKYQVVHFGNEKLIAQIKKDLDISLIDKDIPVVRISFKSPHALKAKVFPDLLAETYINDYIDSKYQAANITVDFLNERIAEITKKLMMSEDEILNYREANSITNIRQETETDLRKLAQLKIQLTNLEMSYNAIVELERYVTEGQEKFLDLAPNFEAFTDLLSTEIIKKIKSLQAEKKDLLLIYTQEDEKVKVIDDKINDLTSYLVESIKNTRKNLEIKKNNLEKNIASEESKFISVPEKEKTLTILNREFGIIQNSYNFLNQKKIEAEIAKAAKISFHRVIEEAKLANKPVSPNMPIIKIVASILGMIAAIILIFIVHSLKARVNDINTLEKSTDLPIASSIKKHKNDNESSRFFKTLIPHWEVKHLLNPNKSIAISGFRNIEGSKYLIKGIANTLIKQGKSVNILNFGSAKLSHLSSYVNYFNKEELELLNQAELKTLIEENTSQNTFCLILNDDIYTPIAIPTMAICDVNLMVLDCRLTPLKRIDDLNLFVDDYKLENVHLVLNRSHYSPSVIREAYRYVVALIKKLKALKK